MEGEPWVPFILECPLPLDHGDRVNGNNGIFCLLEFRFGDILRYYELSTSLLFDREGGFGF